MHYQKANLRPLAHQRELKDSYRNFEALSPTQTNLNITSTGAGIMNPMGLIKNSTNHTTDIKLNSAQTKTLAECQTNSRQLPVFFMSNIQSFSNSSNKSKTVEIEAMLDLNKIDVACLTETWLTENNKDQI